MLLDSVFQMFSCLQDMVSFELPVRNIKSTQLIDSPFSFPFELHQVCVTRHEKGEINFGTSVLWHSSFFSSFPWLLLRFWRTHHVPFLC